MLTFQSKTSSKILCFVTLILTQKSPTSSFIIEDIFKGNNTENVLELYSPTINSKDARCRNHTLYYLEELKKYTLWATEMFDSSTKFPNGVLFGTNYDLGNFDQCIEVKVPLEIDFFSGKYCLARFTIDSPEKNDQKEREEHDYNFDDYRTFYNVSAWEKINYFLSKYGRNPRNTIVTSFCLPSTCSEEDLLINLEENVKKINNNNNNDFKLNVSLKGSCQVEFEEEETKFEFGDYAFLTIFVLLLANVFLSTLYDLSIKKDRYSRLKLRDDWHKLVLCSSLPRNFRKITTVTRGLDNLDSLSGMKVYSMALILWFHRSSFLFGTAVTNYKNPEKYYQRFELMFFVNVPILVDTFFTISGFLATYLLLNQYHKDATKVNLFKVYFHRYMRLTPLYAFLILFYTTVFPKMGKGPLWPELAGSEMKKCRESWWANLLFINNYIKLDNYCMFQSWYMACDMQGFLFVPILCWLIWRRERVGVATIAAAIFCSVFVVFGTIYATGGDPFQLMVLSMAMNPTTDRTFRDVYIPGHMRAAPYFVGVLAGYSKHKIKANGLKTPRAWVRLGWSACGPAMFFSMYVLYFFYVFDGMPRWFSALYGALLHLGWSFGVAWIILATSSGYGRYVNAILSWKPVVVLSRLTYTVYLCHSFVLIYSAGNARHSQYGDGFQLFYFGAADAFLSYTLALFMTMLIESPVLGVEKILLSKAGGVKDNSDKEKDVEDVKNGKTINVA